MIKSTTIHFDNEFIANVSRADLESGKVVFMNTIIGKPRATRARTIEELQDLGHVGIYARAGRSGY